MTVKNPDADASEWHAQKARSGTPRTQGVSPLTRPASLTRLRVDTGSINTTTDMNPGRTPRGTLTLAGAAPSSVSRVIMSTLSIRTRRWTRREYDRLVELGVLHEDEPIELVDGEMVVREPKHPPHTTATELAAEALRLAFGRGWHVRVQQPVALDDDS